MVAIAGKGGLASLYDWRSRLGGILDAMPCNPVVTIKGLVGSLRMTTPDGIIGYPGAPCRRSVCDKSPVVGDSGHSRRRAERDFVAAPEISPGGPFSS